MYNQIKQYLDKYSIYIVDLLTLCVIIYEQTSQSTVSEIHFNFYRCVSHYCVLEDLNLLHTPL